MHRVMKAEEEFKELKGARLQRKLDQGGPSARERSACLVALCPAAGLADHASNAPLDERLVLGRSADSAGSGSSSAQRAAAAADEPPSYAPGELGVVGTLDLYAVRALPGELLIGDSSNAAYLANVCTAVAARRRGVGEALLRAARELALQWGESPLLLPLLAWSQCRLFVAPPPLPATAACNHLAPCPQRRFTTRTHHPPPGVEDLYVHTMAVNEIAVRFYQRNGFEVEKEETSNQAHYRGRCLDGIEGRGRTLLLRDSRLRG